MLSVFALLRVSRLCVLVAVVGSQACATSVYATCLLSAGPLPVGRYMHIGSVVVA